MTGTKGDDAACTVRGRDHLRYASLFSPSPFFFSLPRRLRLKYFPSRATLHTYIYTYTRLYTRFDEIRGRTNIAAGTIPEKVCFFSESRGTSGEPDWTLSEETRFGPISSPGNIEFRNATGLDPRYRESALADTQNDARLRASDPSNAEKKLAEKRPISLHRPDRVFARYRVNPQPN